jgi:hypothetical protein
LKQIQPSFNKRTQGKQADRKIEKFTMFESWSEVEKVTVRNYLEISMDLTHLHKIGL